MKLAVHLMLLFSTYAFPNFDYLGKEAVLLPFFNSIPGRVDSFGETRHTIAGLTGVLPEGHGQNESCKRTNLFEIAKKLNLTKLVEAVIKAGLDHVIDHEGPFTLFGPTNQAFDNVPDYCSNVPLTDIVKYHIVRGFYNTTSFKNNLLISSILQGRNVRMNVYQHNQATTASGQVVSGPDHLASNGILHVLSGVMCSLYKGSAIHELNHCPSFSVLNSLINMTDLYPMLDGNGPLTLFAPTDKAFAKLDPAVINDLKSNITALKEVLLYHVVPDVWYAAGMYDGQLKTVQGEKLTISVTNLITVNTATVVLPDATVSNGVVHAIDAVLIPKMAKRSASLDGPFVPFVTLV